MARFFKLIFWTVVALSVVYLIYLSAWLTYSAVVSLFAGVNDTVKAASITAFVTVTLFLFGRYFEQSRDRKLKINAEKIAVYKRFFDFYFDMFSYEKIHGKPKVQTDVLRELIEFQKDLVFWGSDQVLRAFLNFRDELSTFTAQQATSSSTEQTQRNLARVMRSVALLLVAMRRDIGYSFTAFNAKDLGRLQLADDEETRKILDYL